MGAEVTYENDQIHVVMNNDIKSTNINTLPYPGFPTDLQAQAGVCLALADGISTINETIWESRFQYTSELNKMGAKITSQGQVATFEGVEKLYGTSVEATDLRAGAALLIAGIVADGKTTLYNTKYIDRGYEHIESKFKELGAKIEREEISEDELIILN